MKICFGIHTTESQLILASFFLKSSNSLLFLQFCRPKNAVEPKHCSADALGMNWVRQIEASTLARFSGDVLQSLTVCWFLLRMFCRHFTIFPWRILLLLLNSLI